MPKKAKKAPNTYLIDGDKYPSFTAAAGAAVDLALQSGDTCSIEERFPAGLVLGYVHVTAAGETTE